MIKLQLKKLKKKKNRANDLVIILNGKTITKFVVVFLLQIKNTSFIFNITFILQKYYIYITRLNHIDSDKY